MAKKGFKIIARNYWRKWGEIDIVAQKDNNLHFIEVKTVTRNFLAADDYEPEDNLHPWKRSRLKRVIQTYLLEERVSDDLDWQIDAISIYLNQEGKVLKLDWLEDIIL